MKKAVKTAFGIFFVDSVNADAYYQSTKWNAVNFILDRLGELKMPSSSHISGGLYTIQETWDKKWFKAFDVIELYLYFYDKEEKDLMPYEEPLSSAFNKILSEEKSGYRFVGWQAIPITNTAELELLNEITHTKYAPVNSHATKAIQLFADRENPDYENSIKESISAVESMCCIITELSGASATLGKALRKLKDSGVVIHSAMENAFSSLYGYTSDADGIRHGGIDFTNAPAEDAKYMLLSCSAFVNYLIEKYSQIV